MKRTEQSWKVQACQFSIRWTRTAWRARSPANVSGKWASLNGKTRRAGGKAQLSPNHGLARMPAQHFPPSRGQKHRPDLCCKRKWSKVHFYLHLSGNPERFTHDLRTRGIMVISTLLDVLVQSDDSSYPNLTCMALRKYKRQFLLSK